MRTSISSIICPSREFFFGHVPGPGVFDSHPWRRLRTWNFCCPQGQMDQERPLGLQARHKAYISSYAPCLLPGHRPCSVWLVVCQGCYLSTPRKLYNQVPHFCVFFPVVVISAMVSCWWSRSYYHIALGGMEKIQSDPGEQKDGTTVGQKLCYCTLVSHQNCCGCSFPSRMVEVLTALKPRFCSGKETSHFCWTIFPFYYDDFVGCIFISPCYWLNTPLGWYLNLSGWISQCFSFVMVYEQKRTKLIESYISTVKYGWVPLNPQLFWSKPIKSPCFSSSNPIKNSIILHHFSWWNANSITIFHRGHPHFSESTSGQIGRHYSPMQRIGESQALCAPEEGGGLQLAQWGVMKPIVMG